MRRIAFALMTLALTFAAPVAHAQAMKSKTAPAPMSTVDDLKAASGDQKLKCSGAPGQKTCTSDYAWVCPEGWNACTASPGGTCCTQKAR